MAGFLDEQGLRYLVSKVSTTFVPNNKIHERLGLSGTSDNPILLYELKSGDYTITKDSFVKLTPNSTPSSVTSTDINLTLQRNYYGDLYTQSYVIAGFFNVIYTDEYKITPSESLNDHKFDLTKGSDPCVTTNTYLANFKLNGTNINEGSIYAPTSSGTNSQILASQGTGLAPKWIDFPEHFSGDYNDLNNKPDLFSGDYNDLSNKPTLFSGNYNDLVDKPTIPDLNTLATVAHSGNYNDLLNKPTIPSIEGLASTSYVDQKIATLTENNTDAMDSLKELAAALNNDKNFASTIAAQLGSKADKATTLAGYGITDAKISNGTITLGESSIKPLTSFTETDPTVPDWAKAATKPSYSYSEITDKPTLFSGSYTDLTNKPTIPTVNNATLTIQKNGTSVATFTSNASSNVTANITVPTGAAADKNVDTSITSGSTSTNLPTSKAVAAFVEGKGYLTSNAVTSVNGQTGAVTLAIPTGAAASKGVVTSITTSTDLPTSNAVKTFVEGKGYVTSSGTVAKATTADSATQATKDASGNTITNTYATKTELNTVAESIPSVPTFTAKGSTTKPVYLSADNTFEEASTYAGGTAITLNGTSKAGSTASIYAPISYGSSRQVLRGNGSGLVPVWAAFKTVKAFTGTGKYNASRGGKSIGTSNTSIITGSVGVGVSHQITICVNAYATSSVGLDIWASVTDSDTGTTTTYLGNTAPSSGTPSGTNSSAIAQIQMSTNARHNTKTITFNVTGGISGSTWTVYGRASAATNISYYYLIDAYTRRDVYYDIN